MYQILSFHSSREVIYGSCHFLMLSYLGFDQLLLPDWVLPVMELQAIQDTGIRREYLLVLRRSILSRRITVSCTFLPPAPRCWCQTSVNTLRGEWCGTTQSGWTHPLQGSPLGQSIHGLHKTLVVFTFSFQSFVF